MSHRTQITLSDEQYRLLCRESERSGLPVAELVRRALDRAYGTKSPKDVKRALERSFGSWTERDFDGASYVEAPRHGMARRAPSR